MTPLRIEGLKVERNKRTILDIEELELMENEVLCLVGPNGAGKTSLLLGISCLLQSFRGKLFFWGKEVGKELSIIEYRRKLSMAFQEPLLFDTTVFENIASGLKIRGFKKKEIQERVEKYLDLFKISYLRERNAHTLSGGEAQRVSLARACAVEPEILLLDESFSSLDPHIKESLVSDFVRLRENLRTTIVFATHDRNEVLRLADRVCVIKDGKILQIGKVNNMIDDPRNEWIASFFGIETILEGRVVGKVDGGYIVSVFGRNIVVAAKEILAEKVVLFISPENVTIFSSMPRCASSLNLFAGKIEEIYPLGYYYKLRIDCGFPLFACITKSSLMNLNLEKGKEIYASFKATSVRVIEKL